MSGDSSRGATWQRGAVRILGIDPGLTRCGVGVIDTGGGRDVRLVRVAVLRTPGEIAPERRLLAIHRGIEEIIAEDAPDAMAIERIFAQDNLRSVTGTSQAAGVAMLSAALHHLPLGLHTPSEVKAAVTGNGRAGKKQVQEMVRRILRLDGPPRPADAADALALAICHAWRGGGAGAAIRAQYGGAATLPRVEGTGLTTAQRAWAQAERDARRHGAVSKRT